MTSSAPPAALDHLIHLISPASALEEALQLYTSLGFVVQRGGTHADQLTTNCLITLADGVYLELIAFVDPEQGCKVTGETKEAFEERRNRHWWWNREMGWIDVCLLGGATDGRTQAINERAGPNGSISYQQPIEGARKTYEGNEIRWKVTFPTAKPGVSRGAVPFWCEDVTPREQRVVMMGNEHPNGCTGVASLTLLFDEDNFQQRVAAWAAVLDVDAQKLKTTSGSVRLHLSSPHGSSLIPLMLKRAEDPEERDWLAKYGEGVYEVGINAKAGQLPASAPPDGVERTTMDKGYGRLRFHPVMNGGGGQ
ncbi:hypothetical protein BDZ90DRAFT_221208 [Jaminaea rosea]|uniref:Glyoxalase-like domain-containing protein n=1 Tax=Jaminaea rosea TaxID=1569628 RepID=A0A316UNL0_9BASI|nr:hypothetical protein BDZ90DRAFT_221208 [Jaminaea rosea]PWN26859.1 hypothetical protein BDZ90DRAFT_221208 [Jaminaea rosea]